jgi:hypothetical protein
MKDSARALIGSAFRKACRAEAPDDWKKTESGIYHHGSAGHWSRFDIRIESHDTVAPFLKALTNRMGPMEQFAADSIANAPALVRLHAGVASPYLLKVVNRLEPDRLPRPGYDHAIVLNQVEVRFDLGSTSKPRSLMPPEVPLSDSEIVLGPASVTDWFREALGLIVPRLAALESDQAVLHHLLTNAGPIDDLSLRYAALIARHVGLTTELPAILARAAGASETADSGQRSVLGGLLRNDRDPNMLMWTHERFVSFLESAPA